MPKKKNTRKKPRQNKGASTGLAKSNLKNDLLIDSPSNSVEKKASQRKKRIKQVSFGLIWFYLLSRLILSDIDGLILPDKLGVSTSLYVLLRFLLTTGVVIIIWLNIGNKRFWMNFGLFLLFPIYPLGWKIIKNGLWDFPNFAFRYKLDFLLFSYFDAIISFVVRFKRTLLKWIAFISAVVIMCAFKGWILYFAIFLFSLLQLSHLYKRWLELFGPITLFQINLNKVGINTPFSEDKIVEHVEKANTQNKEKSKKDRQMAVMEQLILIHEFMKLFDKKVQGALSSKSYMKSFIVKAFYSIIYAMIIFSCINYCLFLIDSKHFAIEANLVVGYFDFLYYSFFTIIPDGTYITPLTIAAKSIKMLGVLIGYGINILIFALYIGSNSKKFQQNLEQVSIWSSSSNNHLKEYFAKKYGKNPIDGYEWLRKKGSEIETTIDGLRTLFRQKK